MADIEPYRGVFASLTPQGRMHRGQDKQHLAAVKRDEDNALRAGQRIEQAAELIEIGMDELYQMDVSVTIRRESMFASTTFESLCRGMEAMFGAGVGSVASKHMKGKLK